MPAAEILEGVAEEATEGRWKGRGMEKPDETGTKTFGKIFIFKEDYRLEKGR